MDQVVIFAVVDYAADQITAEASSQPRIEEKADGSVVVDILTPPAESQCVEEEPDPFQNEIVVCRDIGSQNRLSAVPTPSDQEGQGMKKAEIHLSENSVLSITGEQKSVGGTPANAAMINLKIKFR